MEPLYKPVLVPSRQEMAVGTEPAVGFMFWRRRYEQQCAEAEDERRYAAQLGKADAAATAGGRRYRWSIDSAQPHVPSHRPNRAGPVTRAAKRFSLTPGRRATCDAAPRRAHRSGAADSCAVTAAPKTLNPNILPPGHARCRRRPHCRHALCAAEPAPAASMSVIDPRQFLFAIEARAAAARALASGGSTSACSQPPTEPAHDASLRQRSLPSPPAHSPRPAAPADPHDAT